MNMSPIEMAIWLMSMMKILLVIPALGIIAAIIKYRKDRKRMLKNILYYVLLTLLVIAVIFLTCYIMNDAFTKLIEIVQNM